MSCCGVAELARFAIHRRRLPPEKRRYDRSNASLNARRGRARCYEVSVLRSFFGWLTERCVLLFDPAEDLTLGRGSAPLPKAVLTESEVKALLVAPGTDALGLRDRAILETLYSTGLRRAELCNLDLFDVDSERGTVRVRSGKGGRDRVVPIGNHALAALRSYLQKARPGLVAGPRQPALFLAAVTGRRLKMKTINHVVRKHAEAAGLEKRVTPHVLRHTCATHLLQGGADVRHVQRILGHASVATTQIYTRVLIGDLVVAHRRHHPRETLLLPSRAALNRSHEGGTGAGWPWPTCP
ncbi:MAG: tyrosine-type recombinase/integrase [Nitrospiraceae bacterium]